MGSFLFLFFSSSCFEEFPSCSTFPIWVILISPLPCCIYLWQVVGKCEVLEMLSSDMNLVATIIGFGMSATFIVFICTRLLCGRPGWNESRPRLEIESRADLEQQVHRVKGLEPLLVAAIPTVMFHHQALSSIQCSICLEEYQQEQVLRIMPKCAHNFHLHCIDTWLLKQSTCPICRLALQECFHPKPFDDSERST